MTDIVLLPERRDLALSCRDDYHLRDMSTDEDEVDLFVGRRDQYTH